MIKFVDYESWFVDVVWEDKFLSMDSEQYIYNMYYLGYLVGVPRQRIKNLLNENLYMEVYRILIRDSRLFLDNHGDEISEEYQHTVIRLARTMQKELTNDCYYMIRDYAMPRPDKEI